MTAPEKDVALRHAAKFHLIANPNYFGNLTELKLDGIPKAVLKKVGDTSFEALTCLGDNPDTEILTAIVRVKQQTGYGGDTCTDGSQEYVRFDNTGPQADIEIASPMPEAAGGTMVITSAAPGAFFAPPFPGGNSSVSISYAGLSLNTNGASGNWELDTTGMEPCGYNVRIHVRDRTIVSSGSNHWPASDIEGVCLENRCYQAGAPSGAPCPQTAISTSVISGTTPNRTGRIEQPIPPDTTRSRPPSRTWP